MINFISRIDATEKNFVSRLNEEIVSLQDGTTPDFQVKFSGETLQINSWTSRFYYSIFSKVLGSGTTIHLKVKEKRFEGKEIFIGNFFVLFLFLSKENSFLRSIFNLEETENLSNKVEKVSRTSKWGKINKKLLSLRNDRAKPIRNIELKK